MRCQKFDGPKVVQDLQYKHPKLESADGKAKFVSVKRFQNSQIFGIIYNTNLFYTHIYVLDCIINF